MDRAALPVELMGLKTVQIITGDREDSIPSTR